jgi:hypothetical protein
MSKNKCSRNTCKPLTRRNFLKASAAGAATLAIPVGTSDAAVWQSFFQKHFREMNKAEMAEVIKRMEKEYGDKYKTSFSIKTTGVMPAFVKTTSHGTRRFIIYRSLNLKKAISG